MNNKNFERIASFCLEKWREDCEHIIRVADQVCEHRFIFDMPWDMERTSKEVKFDKKINWFYKLDGDNEFLFQFNRHRFFVILAQAYHLTKNDKYVECFVELMSDWIDNVPLKETGDHPWRSLETGLRGEYWTNAMYLLSGHKLLTDDFMEKYKKSLSEHARQLKKYHKAFHYQSNWGVIQDHGLFAIGIELNDMEACKTAVERMKKEASLQLTADGMHWEQSCMYHNEVLNCFLDVIVRAKRNSYPLDDEFFDIAKEMAYVNLKWIKPNHHQPLFGDSDDTDIRDILTLCAYLFDDSYLRSIAFDNMSFEGAWLLPENAIDDYKKIEACEIPFDNVFMDDSGVYVLRTDYGEKANYLFMHNGYTGAGHAHEDKLHFDLCIAGEDVLNDSGRYTYKNNFQRAYLKGYKAHNVSCVDNSHFIRSIGWGYTKLAPSVKMPHLEDKDKTVVLLQGAHTGYLKAFSSVLVTRQILWIKPDIYVVIDYFYSKGFHKYSQFFNFSNNGSVTIDGNNAVYKSKNVTAKLAFVNSKIKVQPYESMFSPNYNDVVPSHGVKTSFSSFGSTAAFTVIYGDKSETIKDFSVTKVSVKAPGRGNKKLKESSAQAIRIKCGEDEYTIVAALEEMMTVLDADGKLASGKLSIIKNNDKPIIFW